MELDLKVFGYINMTRAIYAEMKALGRGVGFPGQPRDLGIAALHEPLVPLWRFARTVATGNAALKLEAKS